MDSEHDQAGLSMIFSFTGSWFLLKDFWQMGFFSLIQSFTDACKWYIIELGSQEQETHLIRIEASQGLRVKITVEKNQQIICI